MEGPQVPAEGDGLQVQKEAVSVSRWVMILQLGGWSGN